VRDDDEILEAYERELDDPQLPRRKRGFPLVIGVLGLSCVFLLVEIFANRSIPNDIGTAQHDLRVAQAAAAQVQAETGSYATSDADGLDASASDGDGIDFVAADEPSQRLGQVSVFANGVTWAAAVQVRAGACFYLKLTAGETDPLYGVGTECTARQALTSKDDRW
jgi:hypothetical protein